MKKAWIFLIVVALLAFSVPVFADTMGPTVKFSGTFNWMGNYDPSITSFNQPTMNSGAARVWPTADVNLDANNTLEIGLRLGNGVGASVIPGANVTQAFGASLWHFMWTSDLGKSAGMADSPVDVKVTIGLMDSVLTNWWYDNNGWEWEYGGGLIAGAGVGNIWDAGLVTINGDSNFLGYGLAVGIGPITLHWVNDFGFANTLVGAEASVSGLGLFVAYGIYNNATVDKGNLAIEAKYAVPQMSGITITPSLFFRDALGPAHYVFGGDLTVGYQMFKVILGATNTDQFGLQHYSATVHVMPVGPADIWVAAYLDGATPDSAPLQAVDIGATYAFGMFKLIVGWVVGGTDQTNSNTGVGDTNNGNNVTTNFDTFGAIRNGLYFGTSISF